MLKLTEILKYLITQPHQTGSQVPAFLKAKAGFVGENGDPDALFKKAQGKKYNSPRNLRTLVLGDVGGVIRYHTGLGNSSDGKLFHSLKHKLEREEEQMLAFIKENVQLPIEELNNQLHAAGFLKSRSNAIIIQNGISKRNLKFLASGGWGDNSYDFAYIEEILIDAAWAKLIGISDRKTDLLGAVPILFGGPVDIAKKFPRLMHIGILNEMDAVKDLTKSGNYKFMLLEAFGNPTQVGVQQNRAGGTSYVFKTPERVYKTFKTSREVYELDAKINKQFSVYKGVTASPQVVSNKVEEIKIPVGVKPISEAGKTEVVSGIKSCPLLVQFLKQGAPTGDLDEANFKRIINIQAKPLVSTPQKLIGQSDVADVLKVLRALLAPVVEPKLLGQLRQFSASKFKDAELRQWFESAMAAKENKGVSIPEDLSDLSELEVEREVLPLGELVDIDESTFEDVKEFEEANDGETPTIEFEIQNRSKFLSLRTMRGFENNFKKIVKVGNYKETINKILGSIKGFDCDDTGRLLDGIQAIDAEASFVDFDSEKERSEFYIFIGHWKSLIFKQLEKEKVAFLRELGIYTKRLTSEKSEVLQLNLKKALECINSNKKVIDSLKWAENMESLRIQLESKLEMIELKGGESDVRDE